MVINIKLDYHIESILFLIDFYTSASCTLRECWCKISKSDNVSICVIY